MPLGQPKSEPQGGQLGTPRGRHRCHYPVLTALNMRSIPKLYQGFHKTGHKSGKKVKVPKNKYTFGIFVNHTVLKTHRDISLSTCVVVRERKHEWFAI